MNPLPKIWQAQVISSAGTPTLVPYEAILFDAGGVLVLPDPTVLAPLLAPLGGNLAVEAHRRAHYAAMAAKSLAGSQEGVWSDYDRAYVDAVGVRSEEREHAAELLYATRTPRLWRWPIPEAQVTLRRLASAGVPMGVVSNASGQIEEELRRSKICEVAGANDADSNGDPSCGGPSSRGADDLVAMRVIIDSEVVGFSKPDRRIFDPALAAFDGIAPDRIIYVGDSVTMDIGGARAAGLYPVLFDPYDDHSRDHSHERVGTQFAPSADRSTFDRLRRLDDLLVDSGAAKSARSVP